MKRGFAPWEPGQDEIELLRRNPKRRRVSQSSHIGVCIYVITCAFSCRFCIALSVCLSLSLSISLWSKTLHWSVSFFLFVLFLLCLSLCLFFLLTWRLVSSAVSSSIDHFNYSCFVSIALWFWKSSQSLWVDVPVAETNLWPVDVGMTDMWSVCQHKSWFSCVSALLVPAVWQQGI